MRTRAMSKWIGAALVAFAAAGAWAQSLGWQQLPGAAVDVGVGGPNNTAWVIGTNAESGGYGIYRWNGSNNWDKIPGSAVRIDVDPKGNAWVVNAQHQIFRYNGSGFEVLPGAAWDVGVGANGTAWVIGTNSEGGGYGIYRWNGSNWDKIPGAAVRIDVDPQGNAWVVNSAHNIYRYDGRQFVQTPGAANDVGIGADGTVFVVGTDSGVYKWTGGNWTKMDGALTDVSVDNKGRPWGVNSSRNIYAAGGAQVQVAVAPPPAAPATPAKVTLPAGSPLTKLVNVTNGPALSSAEANQVFAWIGRKVASERTQYCYKQSYGRGVGTIPTTCDGGKEYDAGLCYTRCNSGYGAAGPVCWQYCPSGYTDTGALCHYSAKSLTTTLQRTGCYLSLPFVGCTVPKYDCPSGYTNAGVFCALNTPSVPPGYSGLTGLDLTKKSYGRGAGTIPTNCGGNQYDAGLCYKQCNAGYGGVGPVCWGNCPSGKTNCGAGCGSSPATCAMDTASMVVSPAIALAGALSGGAATTGWKATLMAVKEGVSTAYAVGNASYQAGMTTYTWVNDAVGTFDQITTKAVNDQVNRSFSPLAARWVKEQYALVNLNIVAPDDGTKTALATLSAASGFDPTGISGVVSAYAKPICVGDEPFPAVHPKY